MLIRPDLVPVAALSIMSVTTCHPEDFSKAQSDDAQETFYQAGRGIEHHLPQKFAEG